ncbi:MAG TPA: nuclear transport factor 2 family protein [Thermoleophilaceae bacterium]|nr:nuclear transport factor 2 family protein [Thermoleophilaceae bacterium]
MSQENVEIVREMYKAFHSGDAEGALAHFDPEVEVDASSRVDGEVGRGHEDLARIISQWTDAFEAWREDIEGIRDAGDRVCVVATQRGRGRESGIDIETRYAVVYEVQRGKIIGMALYAEPAEALEAVGLTE